MCKPSSLTTRPYLQKNDRTHIFYPGNFQIACDKESNLECIINKNLL